MLTDSLNGLSLLGSANFDSQCLLTTVLCGDTRLPERFRPESPVSLGSRIKLRLTLESYDRTILLEYLEHGLTQAGALHLMSPVLVETLVDHTAGNLRVLNNMTAELLISGAQKELKQLDEKLFLEVFSCQQPMKKRKTIQRLPV